MTSTFVAPAKLTLSLRVTGLRADGYHLLESEMVSLDLADTLEFDGDGSGTGGTTLDVVAEWPDGIDGRRDMAVGPAADNLVARALVATGRSARVRLTKRIPPGAGLGGGSADAAAVLRWAGCTELAVAARLGADVSFCLAGGRAMVSGVGEVLTPLPFEERSFVLLLPPFGMDTAAVYRAWDAQAADGRLPGSGPGTNDLEQAATDVEPRMGVWRAALEEITGERARLAGSGSTWFVEGTPQSVGMSGRAWLEIDGRRGALVATKSSPEVQ
jgi:4-diphosphocytidyl-2-C-methyl-D-erythritol kinase